MTQPVVVLKLSPAQARMVNAGLALLECEADTDGTVPEGYRPAVMARTRTKVHDALDRAGIDP